MINKPAIPPAPRQTLAADVYRQIRELLMSGRLMPGEQLSLRKTAAALGVGVMPVREATHHLIAEQVLEVAPNRAVRVATMTVSQFREITAIRIQLEGMAVRKAALGGDAALIDALARLNTFIAHEMGLPQPDAARIIAANKALHFTAYEAAHMPLLLGMIETLWLRVGPILNYDLRSGSSRTAERVAVSHHARLIDALARHDPEAAARALEGDIASAAAFIIEAGVLVAADAQEPVR